MHRFKRIDHKNQPTITFLSILKMSPSYSSAQCLAMPLLERLKTEKIIPNSNQGLVALATKTKQEKKTKKIYQCILKGKV